MISINPQVDAPKVEMAKSQDEYLTITAAVVNHPAFSNVNGPNTRLMAFRLDDDERKKIAEGADLYVSLLTFSHPMNPLIVVVGKEQASAIYNVRTTE